MKGVYLVLVVFVAAVFLSSTLVSAGELHKNLKKDLEKRKSTEEVPVIIKYKTNPTTKDVDSVKTVGKLKRQHKVVNAISGRIRADLLENLAKDSNIERIEPDYKTKVVLDSSTKQIGSDKVWANSTGKGVNIAILDSGISTAHPALTNIVKSVDFTGEGTGDLLGHGTHVAGIVGSQDSKFRGVASGASLFDVKVLNGEGFGEASDLIDGLDWALSNGADIASLSLGAEIDGCDGTDILSESVDSVVSKGLIVVVAAGNSGPNSSTISSPGCSKLGLTVGAVDDGNKVADFSSRGPTADGRVKPDIVAPGVGITSTSKDGGFVSLSGTSMATPHVSGLVALLLQVNSSLKPEDVKNILKATSANLGLDQNIQGSGRVDAYKAYSAVLPKPAAPAPTTSPNPEQNQSLEGNQTELPEEPDRTNTTDPGVLPDKFNYGFKRFSEFLDTFFTADNLTKAQKHTIYAELRVAEAHAIVRGRASLSVNFDYNGVIQKLIDEYQEGVRRTEQIAKEARKRGDTRLDEFLVKRVNKQRESLEEIAKKEIVVKEKIQKANTENKEREKDILNKLAEAKPERAAKIVEKIIEERKELSKEYKEIKEKTEKKLVERKEKISENSKESQKPIDTESDIKDEKQKKDSDTDRQKGSPVAGKIKEVENKVSQEPSKSIDTSVKNVVSGRGLGKS
ncbi:MAG TPA: S8 family serine peptidase [archaeon]|nr:S8 family serine peptidase [archaeon]